MPADRPTGTAPRRTLLWVLVVACGLGLASTSPGRTPLSSWIHYDIPAGDAAETLLLFTEQSGQQIVYFVDQVRGLRTQRVSGRYPPVEALRRMLDGTDLVIRQDAGSSAVTVVRRAQTRVGSARAPWWAVPAPRRPSATVPEVVELSPFNVSTQPIERYRATDAVSAIRLRAPLHHTPSSISVVTRAAIDDIAPVRLFELTRYLPGIQDGRGIQFSDRQIIRGFESNGRTVDNFFQAGADNYEEALIERVEVFKGPNAILSPAGVPGGSINVITKSPRFTPQRQLTAQIGRFDAQKLTLDATGPLLENELAYRLVASHQDTRRYWDRDARLRSQAFAPMLTWRPSEDSLLTGKVVYTDYWSFREPALILDPAVNVTTRRPFLAAGFSSRGRNGIQPWSHVGTKVLDSHATLAAAFSDQVSLRLAANHRHYVEDSTQQFLSTPPFIDRYHPATGVLTQDYTWRLDGQTGQPVGTYSPLFDPRAIPVRGDKQRTTIRTTALQADLAFSRSGARMNSQTVVGGAVGRTDHDGRLWRGTLPPINLLAPPVPVAPVWSASPYSDYTTDQSHWQLYVNQRFGWFEDRVILGGGVMHYDVQMRFRDPIGTQPRPSELSDSQDMVMGSILIKVRDHISWYYSYSTNSAPTVVNEQPIWRDGQQHEVGVKTEWLDQRLAFNVAWFAITQTNVSVPNPDRQTNPQAPEHLLSDLGDHGVEFELVGGVTDRLSLIASHTELRMRDRLGRRVRAVADQTSSLLLHYRVEEGPLRRLSGHIGATHTGSRVGDTTPVDYTPLGVVTRPSFIIPAQTSVQAGVAYRWDRYRISLNVDNILNEVGHIQQAGGRVSGTGLSTAAGRNLKLSVAVRF
jgi:iron complex outermembrane recepter protein